MLLTTLNSLLSTWVVVLSMLGNRRWRKRLLLIIVATAGLAHGLRLCVPSLLLLITCLLLLSRGGLGLAEGLFLNVGVKSLCDFHLTTLLRR